jgi:hypothetical protein
MKAQVVFPCLQAAHYYKQLLFMSWPSQLSPRQLFTFKGNWVSFLHQDPAYYKATLYPCAPQKASQNPRIATPVLTTTSPLKSRMHFVVHPSTRMNPFSSRGQ